MTPPTGSLLVLNAGSSSVKFALFDLAGAGEPRPLLRGQLAGIGRGPEFRARDAAGAALPPPAPEALAGALSHEGALLLLLEWLAARGLPPLAGAGHRVVHGGRDFAAPVRLDAAAIAALEALAPLAPHHQPHNLAAIRLLAARRPDLAQIACFDTAFHATQPPAARRTGLPRAFAERGLLRYGFHGLSYESVVGRLPKLIGGPLPRRLAIAHLGNGASLCALLEGRSVATSMGFSTLDGLVMGTRSGSLDPGLLLHLMRAEGYGPAELEDLLYNRSGLLGLSGISADMRTLLASPDPRAAEAVEHYCYRIGRELGSAAAALGGLDALVFTGGVGENAAAIRARVCRAAAWLGLALDAAANEAGGPCISAAGAAASAWVVPTDEEAVIAAHARRLLLAG